MDYRNTKITKHALKVSRVFIILKSDSIQKKKEDAHETHTHTRMRTHTQNHVPTNRTD